MTERSYLVKAQYLVESSDWIDCVGAEHVESILVRMQSRKSPPVAVTVYAALTDDEVKSLRETQKAPPFGFADKDHR